MDERLSTNLTQGSAILGYGETKRSYVKYVAAFLAVVGILVFLGLAAWALFSPIPLPEDALLTIALPGRTALPEFSPEIWHKAAASGQPIVLGVSKNDDGLHYFAIAPRWAESGGAETVSSGLLKTYLDNDSQALSMDEKAFTFFSQTLIKARGSNAFMTLQLDQNRSSKISGTIRGSTWKTDFKINDSSDHLVSDKQNFIDLKAFPNAWQKLGPALAERFGLELQETPSAVSWENLGSSDYTLVLVFADQIADKTLDTLYAAAGQSRTALYRLADGSVASELLVPDSAEDKGKIAALGLPLEVTLTDKNLIFRRFSTSNSTITCGEKQLAVIDAGYLLNGYNSSPQSDENRGKLVFSADRGNLSICYQVINK